VQVRRSSLRRSRGIKFSTVSIAADVRTNLAQLGSNCINPELGHSPALNDLAERRPAGSPVWAAKFGALTSCQRMGRIHVPAQNGAK
jgi:hypothetical protein